MNEIKVLICFSAVLIIMSLAGASYLWSMNDEFIQKQIKSNQRNVDTKSKLLKSNDLNALRTIAINHHDSINHSIKRNIEMTKDFSQALIALAIIFSVFLFFSLKVRKVLVSKKASQRDIPKAHD